VLYSLLFASSSSLSKAEIPVAVKLAVAFKLAVGYFKKNG